MKMYWHIVNQVSKELKLVQIEIHSNFVGGVIVEKIIFLSFFLSILSRSISIIISGVVGG